MRFIDKYASRILYLEDMSQNERCPNCNSKRFHKNGTHKQDGAFGNRIPFQKYICRSCGADFTQAKVVLDSGIVMPLFNRKEHADLLMWLQVETHVRKNGFDLQKLARDLVIHERTLLRLLKAVGENYDLIQQQQKLNGTEEVKFYTFPIRRNKDRSNFKLLLHDEKVKAIIAIPERVNCDEAIKAYFDEKGFTKWLETATSKDLAYLRLHAFVNLYNLHSRMKTKTA